MLPYLRTYGEAVLLVDSTPVKLKAKELALLIYLRSAGRPISRGEIGDLFWSNISIGRNHSVNTALSALRRVLGAEWIPSGMDPVFLEGEVGADFYDLEVADSEAGGVSPQRLLEMYIGPFMDGFEFQLGEGAEGFVVWMLDRRTSLELRVRDLFNVACAEARRSADPEHLRFLAREGAARIPGWSPPIPPTSDGARRIPHKPLLLGVVGAAAMVAGAVAVFAGRAGAATCGPGKSEAILVRQIYPAEANFAIKPGQRYTPTFILKNAGVCTWSRGSKLRLRHRIGAVALTSASPVRELGRGVPPDSIVQLELPISAPQVPGKYGEDWELVDGYGAGIKIRNGRPLKLRFRVLPPRLPVCASGQVRAELLAKSHPGADNRLIPGQRRLISWTIANMGDCMWDSSVTLRFKTAVPERMSPDTINVRRVLEPVGPSEAYTFEIPVEGSATTGAYREEWGLYGPENRMVPVSGNPTVSTDAVVTTQPTLEHHAAVCAPGEETVSWIGSERVLDGSMFAPGQMVPKAWTLYNRGDCTWGRGRLILRHVRSTPPVPRQTWADITLDRDVPPAATFTFVAPFHAPLQPGPYHFEWSLIDLRGAPVRVSRVWTIWADIHVSSPP
jgi:hypothetical protein